jgi:hypothetical protein
LNSGPKKHNASVVSLDTWSLDDLKEPIKSSTLNKNKEGEREPQQIAPPAPMSNNRVHVLPSNERLSEIKQQSGSNVSSASDYSSPDAIKPERRKSSLSKTITSISTAIKKFVSPDPKRISPGQIRVISAGSLFNENVRSSLGLKEIVDEIDRVVIGNSFGIAWTGVYVATCANEELEFEIEVCKLLHSEEFGILFKRVKGNTWVYESLCREITGQWKMS